MSDSSVRDAYAALAPLYIEMFGAIEQVHPDDLNLIRRQLGDREGPVVDLGCGPGHLTGYLHGLGVQVTGIDPVPEFISHATNAHPGTRFEAGSIATWDAPSHTLSGVLAWYSLIHLTPASIDSVFDALRAASAPGGVLVVGFFEGDEIAAFDHKVFTAYRWPAEEFSRRLARAGFLEMERLLRPRDGDIRPHACMAARAS